MAKKQAQIGGNWIRREREYDVPQMRHSAFLVPTGQTDPAIQKANQQEEERPFTYEPVYKADLPVNEIVPNFSQAAVNRTLYTSGHRPHAHAWWR